MDLNTQRRLDIAYACADEGHELPLINFRMVSHVPGDTAREATRIDACVNPIRSVYDAQGQISIEYLPGDSVLNCFHRILGGDSHPFPVQAPFSSDARAVCRSLLERGELSIRQHWQRDRFLEGLQHQESYTPENLSVVERQRIEGIRDFYLGLLGDETQGQYVIRQLSNIPPNMQTRRELHHWNRAPERLDPPFCRSATLWRRHDLSIPGFRYQIPVLILASEEPQWLRYEEQLEVAFELLKFFVHPESLERILKPGGTSPDFSFVIAPNNRVPGSVLADCGLSQWVNIQRAGGFAHPVDNQIMARQRLFDSQAITFTYDTAAGELRPQISRFLSEIFFHEFSHQIDYRSFNHDDRANLWALLRWMRSEFQSHPSRRFVVPEPNPDHTRSVGSSPYAFSNPYELFAELATEFIMDQIELYSGRSSFEQTTRANRRQELNYRNIYHRPLSFSVEEDELSFAHRRARASIMAQFFSREGTNTQAFSLENIEAAYQREGIQMNLRAHWLPSVTLEPHIACTLNTDGQAGVEAGLSLRTVTRRWPNFSVGLNFGSIYSQSSPSAYGILDVGIQSPAYPIQVGASFVAGAEFGQMHPILGGDVSVRYYPFSDGYRGLQFFLRGRITADAMNGQSTGSFHVGLGWTPGLSLVPIP